MIEKYIDDRINEINNKKPGTISEELKEKIKNHYKKTNVSDDIKKEIDFILKEAALNSSERKTEIKKRIIPEYHTEEEKQSLIRDYIDEKINEANTNYNQIIMTEEQKLKAYEHFKRYKNETYEEIIEIIDSLISEAVYQSSKNNNNKTK